MGEAPIYLRNTGTARSGAGDWKSRRDRTREVVRFRVNDKGVRRPQTGDPVVNRKGQLVGQVTSCSIDLEGYLLGLAIVKKQVNAAGTPIAIFPLGGKPLQEATGEDRTVLPVEATVLTRFPRREKRMGGEG